MTAAESFESSFERVPGDDWRDFALCKMENLLAAEVDLNLFITVDNCKQTDPKLQMAKAICGSCVVKSDCLEYALEHDEQDGVWGGLTTVQRNALKNRRNRAMQRVSLG